MLLVTIVRAPVEYNNESAPWAKHVLQENLGAWNVIHLHLHLHVHLAGCWLLLLLLLLLLMLLVMVISSRSRDMQSGNAT